MIPRPRAGHGKVKHGTAHYWAVVRAFPGEFTARDLHRRCEGVTLDTVRIALRRFALSGHAVVTREIPTAVEPTKVYRCPDRDARAPKLVIPTSRGVQGRRQLQMWRAMRTLRSGWTIAELALAASTDDVPVRADLATAYVGRLERADIVLKVAPKRRAGPRGGSHPASYRLRPGANTGPLAPQVYRGQGIFDPNGGRWVTRVPARPAGSPEARP